MQSELKPCYLLVKRGLYYAPDRQGYTGVKARAGRYRAVDALGLDGVTAIHEDDAAEFSPACWPDTKEAVLRAEITRLTEALRAAEEREKGLREEREELLSQISDCRGSHWLGRQDRKGVTPHLDAIWRGLVEIDDARAALKEQPHDDA